MTEIILHFGFKELSFNNIHKILCFHTYLYSVGLHWKTALVKHNCHWGGKKVDIHPSDPWNLIGKNPQTLMWQHTYRFPSWWHSSTLKHLPYFLFNRMRCACLILTPKYLASCMNATFPFIWTNAAAVRRADGLGPVSNGLRVTGGPILLWIMWYIRPRGKREGQIDTP